MNVAAMMTNRAEHACPPWSGNQAAGAGSDYFTGFPATVPEGSEYAALEVIRKRCACFVPVRPDNVVVSSERGVNLQKKLVPDEKKYGRSRNPLDK